MAMILEDKVAEIANKFHTEEATAMERDLRNKVVAITGGAEGIGFEIAQKYLGKQVKCVILLDINEKKGNESVKELNSKYGNNKAAFLKCDVTTDLDAVAKKLFDTYKTIDVLINNAGTLNEGAVRKTIEINVTALIEWSMKFWEHMRKDKGGKGGTIINLASIYGYRIDQFLPIYQASKFAVFGFTKSLGHMYNFNRSGVRVVAICPGFTETKLTEQPTIWDPKLMNDFQSFLNRQAWQKVESVGNAAIDVFEKTDSGTAWLIEGAQPIKQA